MAGSRQEIQSRMSSVESTKKITNAMQLVAGSRLAKMRKSMESNREYSQTLLEMLEQIADRTDRSSIYKKTNPDLPAFVFMITSDMGLCGAYNANLFREAKQLIKKDDYLCIIGSRGAGWAKNLGYRPFAELSNLNEDIAYMDLSRVMDQAIEMYTSGKISAIQVLYTRFVNAITFTPTLQTILPIQDVESKQESLKAEILFEPRRREMMSLIVPQMAKSVLYADYLESKTSEQASRRTAMETATDNAADLLEDLALESNRLRQSAITQEITEIVSGANALA